MILDKFVQVKVSNNTVRYYRKLGYQCNSKDIINVKISDVHPGASTLIHCKCDYCPQDFYRSANRTLNREKHSCGKKECKQKLREDTNMKLFGVTNAAFCKEKTQRAAEKFKKNFGIGSENHDDYVKRRNGTNINKCGNKRGYLDNGQHSKTMKTLCSLWETAKCRIGSHRIASLPQIHLCELYNGILNMPIKDKSYFGDIVINDIVIEYNGLGHFKYKKINDGEIINDEDNERDLDMIKLGYKIIRIQCSNDKLPNDEFMLKFFDYCKELINDGEKQIIFNTINQKIYLENSIVDCKNI